MAAVVKSGTLKRHTKNWRNKGWVDVWVVLKQDSSMSIYKKCGQGSPTWTLNMKEVCRCFTFGQYTDSMPNRPELPPGGQKAHLLCIPAKPQEKTKRMDGSHRFNPAPRTSEGGASPLRWQLGAHRVRRSAAAAPTAAAAAASTGQCAGDPPPELPATAVSVPPTAVHPRTRLPATAVRAARSLPPGAASPVRAAAWSGGGGGRSQTPAKRRQRISSPGWRCCPGLHDGSGTRLLWLRLRRVGQLEFLWQFWKLWKFRKLRLAAAVSGVLSCTGFFLKCLSLSYTVFLSFVKGRCSLLESVVLSVGREELRVTEEGVKVSV